mmetsp:Transcript_3866/g.15013  ORF Transcript_3866/g.15013 Transcript_3866/m.15013 type:complete len:207 (+) Transcript_3866:587-1207(+)
MNLRRQQKASPLLKLRIPRSKSVQANCVIRIHSFAATFLALPVALREETRGPAVAIEPVLLPRGGEQRIRGRLRPTQVLWSVSTLRQLRGDVADQRINGKSVRGGPIWVELYEDRRGVDEVPIVKVVIVVPAISVVGLLVLEAIASDHPAICLVEEKGVGDLRRRLEPGRDRFHQALHDAAFYLIQSVCVGDRHLLELGGDDQEVC